MTLVCISEVPGSDLGRDTSYGEFVFHSSHWSLHATAGIVPRSGS
jgi:hypothetical protein